MKPHRTLLIILLALSVLTSACRPVSLPAGQFGNQAYITNPSASEDEIEQVAQINNQFAVALYKQLIDEEGNLIYSPLSIYQALLMTYAGAEGETAEQMMKVLGVSDNDDVHNAMNALNKVLHSLPKNSEEDVDPLIFNIVNDLWLQKDFEFEQAFLDKLSANYGAGVNLVDYNDPEAVRVLINEWVESQTEDKIKDLIPEGLLDIDTRLVLSNAVNFKGAWHNQFNPKNTKPGVFNTLDGSKIDVEMMSDSFLAPAIVRENDTILALPYDTQKFAMAIIMPENFESYQKELSAEALDEVFMTLNQNYVELNLTMPKFKADSDVDLSGKLQNMGMVDAFDFMKANFTAMSKEDHLFIDGAIHKAFIDVNEEGTESAAATAIVIKVESAPPEIVTVTLDKPFIYVIYDKQTNAIIFMGHVLNP